MRKTDIRGVLNKLADSADRQALAVGAGNMTALGIPIISNDTDPPSLDLSGLHLFEGLEGVVHPLIDHIREMCYMGRSDVMVQVAINQRQCPELYQAGVQTICFYATFDSLDDLPSLSGAISSHIHYMFDVLQSEAWGGRLFPAWGRPSSLRSALLFPFHRETEHDLFYLVEYVEAGRFLRITMDTSRNSRLRLRALPHQDVGGIHLLEATVNISAIADRLGVGILNACREQRDIYIEDAEAYPEFIMFLRTAGYDHLRCLLFEWDSNTALDIMMQPDGSWRQLLGGSLLILSDGAVCSRLRAGTRMTVRYKELHFHIELTQQGRTLCLSLNQPRRRREVSDYLESMPFLQKVVEACPEAFSNVQVILIHHITREVLALISALDLLKASSLCTLFVKYAGSVPYEYLDALLALPPESFHFYALKPRFEGGYLSGSFELADNYSNLTPLAGLREQLLTQSMSYLEAMRLAAVWLFFKQIRQARAQGQKLLIIEDGGYLTPLINQFCLEGRSLLDVLRRYGLPEEDFDQGELDQSLRSWLEGTLLGGIEHTRNGYDALLAVQEIFGCLAFPAATIAVSEYKRTTEADETARSCVLAMQMMLYSSGKTLTDRRCVVIGSRGNIGRYAVRLLSFILGVQNVCGIDIVVPSSEPLIEDGIRHLNSFDEIPESDLSEFDLFFGVSGCSIINAERLERLLKITRHEDLYFASGSTKTVEYTGLLSWIEALLEADTPLIDGEPVHIETIPIRDLQSRLDQGMMVVIRFGQSCRVRRLHLMAHLMPVNFLYYGVPSETFDLVIAQLLEMAAGLTAQARAGGPLPRRLLAMNKPQEFIKLIDQ